MASCSGAAPGAGAGTAVAADGDVTSGFAEAQPLVLDLGCGNGVFLAGLAAARPDWNVLGIEKKDYRVRQAKRHSAAWPNAGVIHGEVNEVLLSLPDRSLAAVYLLFNDPWPKRRHAVRRLVQNEFVNLLAARLKPDGVFYFASDSAEYTAWAGDLFRSCGWKLQLWSLPPGWPKTEFEQRFVSAGVEIRRFQATR
jgi:tRNA (guanine-N7-)-methyltransferase